MGHNLLSRYKYFSCFSAFRHMQSLHVFVIAASLLVITLSVNLQVPLYNDYAEKAGYGSGRLAVAFSAYVVGLLPVLILLGGISDRVGRKRIMLSGLLLIIAANTLIIIDPSMQTLINVRILQGVSVGLSLGAGTAFLAETLKDSGRAANISGIVVAIGLGSGALVTSISMFYDHSYVPYSYYGMLFASILCLFMMLFIPDDSGFIVSRVIRFPFITSNTMQFCIAIFMAWSLTGIIISAIPAELLRYAKIDWSGLLVFFSIGVGAFVQPLAKRLGSDKSMSIGYALLTLGYLLLLSGVYTNSLTLILISAICSGISSFGFIYLGGLSAVVRESDHEKARAVSGYFLFAYIGLGLPCILIGYISDYMGLLSALTMFETVLIIASVVLYFIFALRSKAAI